MENIKDLSGLDVMRRYRKIIPYYLGLEREINYKGNTNFIDNMKCLKQEYLSKIRERMEKGEIAQTIEGLMDEHIDKVYMDDDISRILGDFGIAVSERRELPRKNNDEPNPDIRFGMTH